MKKVVVMIILSIMLMTFNCNVYAADTLYTINKYNEEELDFILESYTSTKEDGYVVAGTYLKEVLDDNEEKHNNNQIMLIKYDKTGNIIWNYDYGKNSKDALYYLTYSYNEKSKINGYILLVDKTYEISENKEDKKIFIIVNSKGKLVKEQETDLPSTSNITKIIPSYNNNLVDGYILVGSIKKEDNEIGIVSKYNLEYKKEWQKEYEKVNSIKDIISINTNESQEFIIISESKKDEEALYQLTRLDSTGNMIKTIKEDFETKDNPSLIKDNNGYVVYGKTYEVKLNNNKTESFYLNKYNTNDNEEWETIGNNPINVNKSIKLQRIDDEYILLYTSDKDSSIEIVKIDSEGLIKNKIKKINNEYYNVNDFLLDEETIYFVGQVKCPEDDTCDYNAKSLFLVSDKDKVIELKDNDSKIIIAILVIVISIIVYFYIKRKKTEKKH